MSVERRLKKRHTYYYSRIYDENTHQQTGRLVDISINGLRLISDEPIKTNTNFQLKMVLPKKIKGKRTIAFDVTCKWCKKVSSPDLYDAGYELTGMNPESTRIIKHLITEYSSV